MSICAIESATGFATICGEVAALCGMAAAGQRDLETIAAVWRSPDDALHLLPPCGRCRELIAEFNSQAWVILSRMENHWDRDAIQRPAKVPIGALLPRKPHQLKG
jgi:cytidine deaminase